MPSILMEIKMVNKPLIGEKHLSRSMMILMLWAGLFGIAVQFNEGLKNFAIWIGLLEFICLIITSKKYDEREQQLLSQSFALAFQFLAVFLLLTYGFLQISAKFDIANTIASFINSRWIGLTVSEMALLLGISGLILFKEK
jgi:hypothetical protein